MVHGAGGARPVRVIPARSALPDLRNCVHSTKRHKTVDDYIEAAEPWQDELIRLRKILRSTDLEETVKWGAPCYTHDGKNVVGMASFKSYVGLWFHQGALLGDKKKVLINAQEGKTKALRQWRFRRRRRSTLGSLSPT